MRFWYKALLNQTHDNKKTLISTMKFKTPTLGQYISSLIIAGILGAIAFYALSAQGITDIAFFLTSGLILGHLAGSFPLSGGNPTKATVPTGGLTSLYVGNLAYRAQRDGLQELFSRYGNVHSVRIMTDRDTRKPRGYAFVEMDAAGAKKAIEKLENMEFCGRPLRVSEAKQRIEE